MGCNTKLTVKCQPFLRSVPGDPVPQGKRRTQFLHRSFNLLTRHGDTWATKSSPSLLSFKKLDIII